LNLINACDGAINNNIWLLDALVWRISSCADTESES